MVTLPFMVTRVPLYAFLPSLFYFAILPSSESIEIAYVRM